MGLKEAFRKVGQAIEETKMKIGMKKYKKGGIQIEEKDQKPEMVIPVNDISLPEEKKKTEDAEIRKIEDLPAYEDRKFYIAAKMQVEPEEVESAMTRNIHPMMLGKRILRTETAGMALLSILMFQMQGE